ncbi:MAG TPA: response regulator transcription factor [Arcobacter sp.]|nr:response regulator transcription factor [Arcobacter sp.]
MKILLIEDNADLNIAISDFLKVLKYDVVSVLDGSDAITVIDNNKFDLYITDINIPHVSGLDIVKYIRQKDLFSSIIVITALLGIENFVDAFNFGCSEYIKKPFHLKELNIRIKKLLEKNIVETFRIDEHISYNFKSEELYVNGEVVHLRKKANKLLQILLQNVNETVKNDDIINFVWENDIKEKYPLRQLVTELRKNLASQTNYITTKVSVGYKFSI